jgi:hypothetical protein
VTGAHFSPAFCLSLQICPASTLLKQNCVSGQSEPAAEQLEPPLTLTTAWQVPTSGAVKKHFRLPSAQSASRLHWKPAAALSENVGAQASSTPLSSSGVAERLFDLRDAGLGLLRIVAAGVEVLREVALAFGAVALDGRDAGDLVGQAAVVDDVLVALDLGDRVAELTEPRVLVRLGGFFVPAAAIERRQRQDTGTKE